MPTEFLLLGVLFAALAAYLLLGGADFGAGVWDLFAAGKRKAAQRDLIEHAIGPVWEANHVWLIFAVVILFSAFPKAFAALSLAFYAPLTLLLLGIVFRGSAFAFRHALADQAKPRKRWGVIFSLASIASPFLLGTVIGGAASAQSHWASAFSLCVGALTLALCALLAAVYLVNETHDAELQKDFRIRSYAAAAAALIFAPTAAWLSRNEAPVFFSNLVHRPESASMFSLTALMALGGFLALKTRPKLARSFCVTAVLLLLGGWAVAQFPYLKMPDLTVANAAASQRSQRVLLIALGMGALVLAPSLFALFRIFKSDARQP